MPGFPVRVFFDKDGCHQKNCRDAYFDYALFYASFFVMMFVFHIIVLFCFLSTNLTDSGVSTDSTHNK